MDDSILNNIKKMLGLTEDYTHFDPDIIIHINSVFSSLAQIGVGPLAGFTITDNSSEWSEYISDDVILLDLVKMYVYIKVKLVFDPPVSNSAVESMKKMLSEYEWRIFSIVDYKD